MLQGAVVDGLAIEEPESERVPVARYSALAKAGELDTVRTEWLAHPMMRLEGVHGRERAMLERIVADYGGADLHAYDPSHYAFDIDVPASLAASAIPVLLLTGRHETDARKAHAEHIRRRVLNCRETVFEASGHLSNLTEPALLNEAIGAFIDAVERNPA